MSEAKDYQKKQQGHSPIYQYDRETFEREIGHNYSRCTRITPHPAHSWCLKFSSVESKRGWWWCSGEKLVDEKDIIKGKGKASEVEFKDIQPEENRALPVKWADRAMFEAEPIDATKGPQVYLLWMTPDPLGAIAAACKMYKGEVVRDLSTITDDERRQYLAQVMKTKLQAPFEFVKFHFMIEGVTRSFTHQMVRQRTAVYAQESLRFAVKEDMPVGLPPSLVEMEREDGNARDVWESLLEHTDAAYNNLVGQGIPAEDARGILPHNVLTRLHYSTDLRALLDHAGNRLCTQAQFEWRLVFTKIVEAIRKMGDPAGATDDHYLAPVADGLTYAFMADLLADSFRPVCYSTGKCEFMADFDRACSIRDRVQANAAVNRPSSEWDKQAYLINGERIEPIRPAEWLLDPTAARKKG